MLSLYYRLMSQTLKLRLGEKENIFSLWDYSTNPKEKQKTKPLINWSFIHGDDIPHHLMYIHLYTSDIPYSTVLTSTVFPKLFETQIMFVFLLTLWLPWVLCLLQDLCQDFMNADVMSSHRRFRPETKKKLDFSYFTFSFNIWIRLIGPRYCLEILDVSFN